VSAVTHPKVPCLAKKCTRRGPLIPCIESMLELTPSDPIIKTYLKDLQHLKQQEVVHGRAGTSVCCPFRGAAPIP
jgi:hypothetical protein